MPDTPSNGRSEAWLALRACLQQLLQGPWRFIRLRGGDLGEEAIDGDDVDLLGSRESATALLDAALAWVRAGQCHLRVRTTHRSKISLSLLATDGRHRLDLDLWIDLRQIDHRRRSLTYQDCRAAVLNPDAAIQRLPAPLEACIFLHHLQAKRKKLTDPKQLARLSAYAAELRTHGPAPSHSRSRPLPPRRKSAKRRRRSHCACWRKHSRSHGQAAACGCSAACRQPGPAPGSRRLPRPEC